MVSVVTIKNKVQLYKGEEPANSIELLQFEEVDFEVVRGKDLNQIGDQLLLIYPDFNIPDNELFAEYYRPGGDESKSKLGKNGRVRAVKFNLHRGDGQPVFSNGIVLTDEDIKRYAISQGSILIPTDFRIKSLDKITDEDLGITKYTPPEESNLGGVRGGSSNPFPSDMYKTDEPNILTVKSLPFPARYTIRDKEDGSSISIWYRNGKSGICSRNLSKPLTEKYVSGHRDLKWWERIYKFFGKKIDTKLWSERESINDFVRIGKPYLDKLIAYCENQSEVDFGIVLRGELSGKGLNGSGNKNNRLKDAPQDIRFFGADWYYQSGAERMMDDSFVSIAKGIDIPVCNLAFDRVFQSREDLITTVQEYFNENKNLEGVVARTEGYSVKCLNLLYDSLK